LRKTEKWTKVRLSWAKRRSPLQIQESRERGLGFKKIEKCLRGKGKQIVDRVVGGGTCTGNGVDNRKE